MLCSFVISFRDIGVPGNFCFVLKSLRFISLFVIRVS